MKPKVKRVIAREGLIIVTLIFLAGTSFFIDLRLSRHKSLYEAYVQEIQPVIPVEKDPLGLLGGQYLNSQGIILRFPKRTNNDVIKQTIRRDFSNIKGDDWIIFDSPKGENINASYDEKGKRVFNSVIYKIGWPYVYLFFLIFAYPLYLIIRFVIWAIGILKKTVDV